MVTQPTELHPTELRRDRRFEGRRAEILRAAAEVFNDLGYEAATLDAVGDRVGLSKTSLYYYVRSKEDLLAQILVDALARIEAGAEAAHPGDDPLDRLRALCRSHVTLVCTDPRSRLIARHASIRERATDLAHTGGRYRRSIETLIEDGIARGEFRPVDPAVGVWTFLLAMNGVTAWWTPEGGRSPVEAADEIFSFFLEGLRPSTT